MALLDGLQVLHVWSFLAVVGLGGAAYCVNAEREASAKFQSDIIAVKTATVRDEILLEYHDNNWKDFVKSLQDAADKNSAVDAAQNYGTEYRTKLVERFQLADTKQKVEEAAKGLDNSLVNYVLALLGTIVGLVGIGGWYKKEHPYGIL